MIVSGFVSNSVPNPLTIVKLGEVSAPFDPNAELVSLPVWSVRLLRGVARVRDVPRVSLLQGLEQ